MGSALMIALYYGVVPIAVSLLAYAIIKNSYGKDDDR